MKNDKYLHSPKNHDDKALLYSTSFNIYRYLMSSESNHLAVTLNAYS